jgi:hypothetical protein
VGDPGIAGEEVVKDGKAGRGCNDKKPEVMGKRLSRRESLKSSRVRVRQAWTSEGGRDGQCGGMISIDGRARIRAAMWLSLGWGKATNERSLLSEARRRFGTEPSPRQTR